MMFEQRPDTGIKMLGDTMKVVYNYLAFGIQRYELIWRGLVLMYEHRNAQLEDTSPSKDRFDNSFVVRRGFKIEAPQNDDDL